MGDSLLIDSAGEVQSVAPEGVPAALQMGWIAANPAQIEKFNLSQKYGSGAQTAIAGLEGAGRGLTLGLSTPLERALGVPAEDIAGRESENPIAAGAGEAVGIALPLLATDGGALALTGPSLAMRAGRAVTGALAPEAAASMAARILGRAGAAAAGSAVEGAFYGAGRVVHEAALGDPNLTAESALATVGLSAAVMGGFGGMGKLFGSVAREYAPRELGAKVDEMLMRAEAHGNYNATNAMPNTIKAAMRGKGEGAVQIGLEARDLGILRGPLSDSPDAILERAEAIQHEVGQGLGQIAKTADEVNAATGSGSTTWTKVYQDVHGPIMKELLGHGDTVPIAKQFDAVLQNFAEAHAGQDLGASGLWELRQEFDRFVYKNGRVLDPWIRDVNTPVSRVRAHIDGLLERSIEQGAGADGLKAWRAANRQYEVASTFATLAESGVERNAANNPLHISGMMGAVAGALHGGPLGAAVMGAGSEALRRRGASAVGMGARMIRDALAGAGGEIADKTAEAVAAARQAGGAMLPTGEPAAVAVLSALEKNNQAVARAVDAAATRLLNAGSNVIAIGRGTTATRLARGDFDAEYAKRVAAVQRLALAQPQLQQALTEQTADWYEHAPKTAQALNTASSRAVAYLAGKVPQTPPRAPMGATPVASQADKASFMRAYEAVADPLREMKRAAAGASSNEGIEALHAVYPALMPQLQKALGIKSAGREVPYQARMIASRIMQSPMDASLAQPHVAAAMASFAPPQPPMKPRASAGKLTLGKRSMTSQQAAAERE